MAKRKIQPAAIDFIDKRLKSNALASECIANKNARQLFVETAKSCLGIKEAPNKSNRGKEVELIQQTVGASPGDQWCMAFIQTCVAYAELKTGVSSPIYASSGCLSVWNNSPVTQRVQAIPLAGAIAIWQHVNNSGHGHTGMVLDCDGVSFHAIEGNVARGEDNLRGQVGQSGDGVRFTQRYYDLFNTHYSDMKLLGSLKPF